ncbi:MAG: phage resistance protein, partial [Desulfobacterales bacterium]|nr:phage resistance protein [Desulfobacterales bacterium]
LCAAFGLDMGDDEAIDGAHELSDHFQSLDPGFEPRPPAATSLKGAMENLLHQAMDRQFPAHPRFEDEIRPALLRKVHDVVSRAARTRDGRISVERALRASVGRIADPLLLGEMGETHFVLGRHWKNHFDRKAAEAGGEITVGRLREWMDQPEPMGLPEIAGSLVILIYAEQTNRSFFLHGEPREAALTSLRADMEIREGVLPPREAWEEAVARAETLFSGSAFRLLNATNVSSLAHEVRGKSKSMASACRNLDELLKKRLQKFGVEPEKADR